MSNKGILLNYFCSPNIAEDSMSVCSFGSRADLDRLSETPLPSWIQVGESVMVTSSKSMSKMTGVIQFVGNVEFASGPWVGVELDLPEGLSFHKTFLLFDVMEDHFLSYYMAFPI